jgi:hypothetical protein
VPEAHWLLSVHEAPSACGPVETGPCVGGAGVGCGVGGGCVDCVGCVPCCIGGGGWAVFGGGDDETKHAVIVIVAISNSLSRMDASYTPRDG